MFQCFRRATGILEGVGEVMVRPEMLRSSGQRLLIKRNRADRAALAAVARIACLGHAAQQQKLDVRRKLSQGVVERATICCRLHRVLGSSLRDELPLAHHQVRPFVRGGVRGKCGSRR